MDNVDSSVRILLADDHDLVRAGMRSLFDRLPNVAVIAEASDGREAFELIRRQRPDVAFVDISMPGLNGLELIRKTSKVAPAVRLIVLSMHGSESYIAEALRAGAWGYLLKQDTSLKELELAINCVVGGNRYLPPAISAKVVDGNIHSISEPLLLQTLSPRQREILQLIGEGNNNKEIAYTLNISVKTVETHRAELMARLNIRDVAGLVRYAIKSGIVSLE